MAAGSTGQGADGFAVVDALVALTILATTFALSLEALGTARRLAGAALETRRAGALLQVLLETDPGTTGTRKGRTSGFDWRVEVVRDGVDPAAPALSLCHSSAEAVSMKAGRRYQLSTAEFCARPDQPS